MSLDFSLYAMRETEVFDGNITHNLTEMADACGLYAVLWRPSENGFKTAREIIPLLEKGLHELQDNPYKFKQFNAPNGWGEYGDFVRFVRDVLVACRENPDARIEASV